MEKITVSVKNLNKHFGGINALDDVNIDFYAGEVHALMGENGAGKSTLCKILSGAYKPDAGKVVVFGKECVSMTPASAKAMGIGMIYQEFNLVNDMTVYENIYLGKELRKGFAIDKKAMIEGTRKLFTELGIGIDPTVCIRNLSVAYCQLVEIAKALQENARILILDEPTAALTQDEINKLFAVIRRMRDNGMTIIYITHRMNEIDILAERVTVMRDGKVISTMQMKETTRGELIRLMIGRALDETFPKRKASNDISRETPALSVRNLSNAHLHNLNIDLYSGEILGIAGLVGAGRTELVRAIFGADSLNSGEIQINNALFTRKIAPKAMIRRGVALVPEDRKRQGIHLDLPIRTNITLSSLDRMSRLFVINGIAEKEASRRSVQALNIKCSADTDLVGSLSGGNQQKAVLSKWLMTEANVFLLDEPTRGVDVGAKKEIYGLLDKMRNEGKSIIMISSEMPEIIGMCDRIICLYEGQITGSLLWEDATQEKIMERISGYYN